MKGAHQGKRLWWRVVLALAAGLVLALTFAAYLQPGLLLDFSNLLSCG
jgi:hypothetical protein